MTSTKLHGGSGRAFLWTPEIPSCCNPATSFTYDPAKIIGLGAALNGAGCLLRLELAPRRGLVRPALSTKRAAPAALFLFARNLRDHPGPHLTVHVVGDRHWAEDPDARHYEWMAKYRKSVEDWNLKSDAIRARLHADLDDPVDTERSRLTRPKK
jgi:hypothetical protein